MHQRTGFTRDDTKILKGLAILLMMVHHLFAFPGRIAAENQYISMFQMWGEPIEYVVGSVGKICVAMFVFLGGYGTYCSCREKSVPEISQVLWMKIKALYKQYWQVFLVFIPVCYLFRVEQVKLGTLHLLWNFTGLKPYFNGEWWFFTPYLALMISYPIMHNISRKFQSVFSEFVAILAANTIAMFVLPDLHDTCSWAAVLPESYVYELFRTMTTLLSAFWMGILFAKHDLFGLLKMKTAGNTLYCAVGALVTVLLIGVRFRLGGYWDFFLTPVLIGAILVMLNCKAGTYIGKIILPIGKESTFCWLIHSFYCYHLCQKLVFMPRYSPLIVLWLLVMTFGSAKLIHFLFKWIFIAWGKVQRFFAVSAETL